MIDRAFVVDNDGAVESGKRTVEIGQQGLAALGRAFEGPLGTAFCDAVRVIGELGGRVIVTGVGKSGHIGSKIASTLASTGTPAFFVHPAEANHGDLGMIGRDDVILAMSWSGETAELQGIIAFTQRFSIPLISITSGPDSALARASNVVLLLPKEKEACPHGLAPTTSTLMQLSIGDALAIALLEARGFTATDFRTFHPGGKLGASLTQVSEIMHTGDEIPLVGLGTLVPHAALVLSEKRFGCVGVVDAEGVLAGIVTNGDIARNMSRNLSETKVDDIMSRGPKTVKPDTLAMAALATLNAHNISALLITGSDSRVVGILGFHDLLRIGVA